MVDNIVIWPYTQYSKGYKNLNKSLGLSLNRPLKVEELLNARPSTRFNILINWGSGSVPAWLRSRSSRIINEVGAINLCSDKLRFFQEMQSNANGPRIPEFTNSLDKAMEWIESNQVVLGRLRKGSCGSDIHFYEDDLEKFQHSEWWSLYKKKLHEFRIHIFEDRVISEQQKVVRTTDLNGDPIPTDTIDYRIRNHKNGFIFKRNDISIPNDVREQALKAVAAVPGLTFGAVDVIYNKYENKAYVLEINTAPGLEGTTLEDYAAEFKKLL